MTQAEVERMTAAQLKAQSQRPQTKAESLRQVMKNLEMRITKLSEISPEQTLEILSLFDDADHILGELQERGMEVTSELGQLETLRAQFYKMRATFIRKIGGPQELAKARQRQAPSSDRWWWYVDKSLAEESKQKTIQLLRNFGILAALLIIAILVYNRFFAPDPAIQASYGHQQRAENAVIEGNLEDALVEVQQALAYTPEDANLYVLQGVILDGMDRSKEAVLSYNTAINLYEQEDYFYNQRAIIYLMFGSAEQALADCETAIQINPESAISYLNMGQAYQALGDINNAIVSYETADEIAQRSGNAQLQAIIRISMSNAYQQISLPTYDLPSDDRGENP
jgi:tetratricopeptide (TPR) repeat protein